MKNFSLLISFAILIFLPSCSSTSSKGGSLQGEAGFSDQDLGLSEGRWGDGNIPQAQADGLFKDIHFEYDSAAIRQEYYDMMKRNAEVLSSDEAVHVEVEGHCDSRGTNEYNLALGEERARAVAAVLVSYGVRPSQISTISYGEEIPIDPRQTEEAYAQNRRVHFALYRRKAQ